MQNFKDIKINPRTLAAIDGALRTAIIDTMTEMSNKGYNTREILAVSMTEKKTEQKRVA